MAPGTCVFPSSSIGRHSAHGRPTTAHARVCLVVAAFGTRPLATDVPLCYRDGVKLLSYFAASALVLAAFAAACSTKATEVAPPGTGAVDAGGSDADDSYPATYLAAEPQRTGDA